MSTYLWIGLGGFLGANARYLVTTWALMKWGAAFPYGTLAANLSGSFILCFLVAFCSDHFALTSPLRLALMVGFLGSYTTFSTFSQEWLLLLQRGDVTRGVLYVLASVLGGGLAGATGLALGRFTSG